MAPPPGGGAVLHGQGDRGMPVDRARHRPRVLREAAPGNGAGQGDVVARRAHLRHPRALGPPVFGEHATPAPPHLRAGIGAALRRRVAHAGAVGVEAVEEADRPARPPGVVGLPGVGEGPVGPRAHDGLGPLGEDHVDGGDVVGDGLLRAEDGKVERADQGVPDPVRDHADQCVHRPLRRRDVLRMRGSAREGQRGEEAHGLRSEGPRSRRSPVQGRAASMATSGAPDGRIAERAGGPTRERPPKGAGARYGTAGWWRHCGGVASRDPRGSPLAPRGTGATPPARPPCPRTSRCRA